MDATDRSKRHLSILLRAVIVTASIGCGRNDPYVERSARTRPIRDQKEHAMDAGQLLNGFKRDKYWWSGKVAYAFWGGEVLDTYLELGSNDEPSEGQLRVLNTMVTHDIDIRRHVESKLAEYYRKEIFLSMTNYSPERGNYGAEEITPPIRGDSDMWKLVDKPSVFIRPEDNSDQSGSNVFRLAFDCQWDPEHGLGIEFRDWKIAEFGGSAD